GNPLAHYLMSSLFFASRERMKVAYPLRVRAELYRGHRIEGEDTSCLEVEVEGGARVFFFATLCSPFQSDPSQRIIGTKGVIDWTFGNDAYIRYADGSVEVIREDGRDERVELFRNVIRYLRGLDENISCPLVMTRPFVLALNGAYESARQIKQIPDEFIIRRKEGDSISTIIVGIDEIINRAFEERRLFSDLGVEWAYKTEHFSLENYKYFSLRL
ncbi:MAG: gfo/Idh/MocA family oxidoreductase, partial [Candidatus Bathyarchaeia archaeon]